MFAIMFLVMVVLKHIKAKKLMKKVKDKIMWEPVFRG